MNDTGATYFPTLSISVVQSGIATTLWYRITSPVTCPLGLGHIRRGARGRPNSSHHLPSDAWALGHRLHGRMSSFCFATSPQVLLNERISRPQQMVSQLHLIFPTTVCPRHVLQPLAYPPVPNAIIMPCVEDILALVFCTSCAACSILLVWYLILGVDNFSTTF